MTQRQQLVEQYENLSHGVPHWYMDAPDLLSVIEYYEERGQMADAEYCLRQAMALHPQDESLQVKFAYQLRSQGKISEAESIISKLNPDLIDVLFFNAEEALARFDLPKARSLFDKILTTEGQGTPDWGLRIDVAQCYIAEGHTAQAEELLHAIPDKYKEGKTAHTLLSEIHYCRHDLSRAIQEINKAIDLDPYDVSCWSTLAELQYEDHHIAQAQEACQYALAINPRDEKALRVSFFAYLTEQKQDQALAQATKYVEYWPNEYYLPMHAAELCAATGHIEDALTFFRRANCNCPDDHQDRIRILSGVAQVMAQQGRFDQSFQTLQCTCARGTSYPMVCAQMALLAADMGNTEYACQRLREIIPYMAHDIEVRRSVEELLRDHPLFTLICPELIAELHKLNTSSTL